ncbi:hypothetical protein H4219_001247 [Mycoemilia scoparia]|uniref:HpcH/HpaI aldolase/citrate lyase domain-containing protein n=1 Tax=Mycoemilia scoparia TaxID=417184 RepID=A0A9W8DVZ8_9FUNG|nr:hypothetical protein H4219_001247 [Mycoemilia scoparia]
MNIEELSAQDSSRNGLDNLEAHSLSPTGTNGTASRSSQSPTIGHSPAIMGSTSTQTTTSTHSVGISSSHLIPTILPRPETGIHGTFQQQQQSGIADPSHSQQISNQSINSPYPTASRGLVWDFYRIVEHRVSGNTDRAECILCGKKMLGKSADMKRHIVLLCPNRGKINSNQHIVIQKIREQMEKPKTRSKRNYNLAMASSSSSQPQHLVFPTYNNQPHSQDPVIQPPSYTAVAQTHEPYTAPSTSIESRHKYPRLLRPDQVQVAQTPSQMTTVQDRPQTPPRFLNRLKMKLDKGVAAFGIWLDIPSPLTARIVSRLGFDWACVDMEHSPHSATVMAEMVAAIASSNACTPIVRVPSHNIEWFKWALDAGAHGVIIPMVNTVEEMRKIVSYCRYPPVGTRSSGAFYAPYTYGFSNACANEYAAQANQEILVIPQIESKEAVENVNDILSVPGIDAAFIGPYDLHLSLGLQPSGEGFEPEFIKALEKITKAARLHNVPLGIYCSSGEAAKMRANQGFRMLVAVNDTMALLSASADNLSKAKN